MHQDGQAIYPAIAIVSLQKNRGKFCSARPIEKQLHFYGTKTLSELLLFRQRPTLMNSTHNITKELPETILEEAAIWQARLQHGETDIELQKAFNIWLAADARHRQAYEEMELLWGTLETPVTQLMAEQSDHSLAAKTVSVHKLQQQSLRHRFQHLALAACLVLTIVIGWQQDWATHWQSDYVTAIGEETSILMADNSRITLNTDSALAVDFTAERRQVRLLKGEAWFEVTSADNRPFIVATSAGSVRVTGTRFNVRLHQDAAIVSLDEGQVELSTPDHSSNPNGSPVVLSPGQQAMLSSQGISSLSSFDHTAITAWLRKQFVFYDTPLAEVVDTLNRHRYGRIIIINQKLKALKISGVFSTNELDTALDVMANTLPIHLTRLTDYLVLIH